MNAMEDKMENQESQVGVRDGHKLGGIHVLGGNCRLNPLLIFGDKA